MKEPKHKGILGQGYSTDRNNKPELRFRLSVRAGLVADALERYSTSTSGLRILDLGAAEGKTVLKMNELLPGNEFTGVEYSKELIDLADGLPGNISLVHGDAMRLPGALSTTRFDVVSALAVLEHLKTPLDAVLQAYEVLKPGGFFVATCPVPTWDHISQKLGLLKDDQHEKEMDKGLLTSVVSDAGLELIEYRKFMWAPISFMPYLHVPISPASSIKCDRLIESFKILNWLFVNQVVIGRKPS
jgi:SAM-dependent methyltransferase